MRSCYKCIMLENTIADLDYDLNTLENLVHIIQVEWDNTYPYEALEFALRAIEQLAGERLQDLPEDEETLALLTEASEVITPKLMEPVVFYLT